MRHPAWTPVEVSHLERAFVRQVAESGGFAQLEDGQRHFYISPTPVCLTETATTHVDVVMLATAIQAWKRRAPIAVKRCLPITKLAALLQRRKFPLQNLRHASFFAYAWGDPVRDPELEPEKAHYTYFIEAVGASRVKIGRTNNGPKRLMALRCGSPVELRCVALCSSHYWPEHELHSRFSATRLHGEWFEYGDEIKGFIAANTTHATPAEATP